MQKYLSLTVGGLTLGVSMAAVVAIEQSDSLPVGSPGGVTLGTVPSGRVTVPLYNFSLLLGRGDARQASTGDVKYIIVRCETGDIALSVDGVGQVMDAQGQDVLTLPPIFSGMERAVFPELLHGSQVFTPLLNPDAVEGAVLVFQMEQMGALVPDIEADLQPGLDHVRGVEPLALDVDSGVLEVDEAPFCHGALPELACHPEGLQGDLHDALSLDLTEMAPDVMAPEPMAPETDGDFSEDPLSDHVAQAIGPELLERVVGRVVVSMIKAFESEMADAQDDAL